MPTYDYQCTVCGHVFEHFQSMFEEPLQSCPRCQAEVKRMVSAGSGLIFKGSGFYITDYKRNQGTKPAEKAQSQADKTTASPEPAPKSKTTSPKGE